jgi:cytoskeletal protein CcmA (bactofilin family)
MASSTLIGRTSFVRGRIIGTGDVEIAGRVEGEISSSGEVSIDATGLVAANVSASRIVVRGAVKGDLTAEDTLVVESGARIVGDLKAPRIAIAPGGLVRGHVQTSGAGPARASRANHAQAARPAPAAKPAAKPAPPPKPKPAPPPPAAVPKITLPKAVPPPNRGATLAGTRPGPPPPVVPILKKGTKAIAKKR